MHRNDLSIPIGLWCTHDLRSPQKCFAGSLTSLLGNKYPAKRIPEIVITIPHIITTNSKYSVNCNYYGVFMFHWNYEIRVFNSEPLPQNAHVEFVQETIHMVPELRKHFHGYHTFHKNHTLHSHFENNWNGPNWARAAPRRLRRSPQAPQRRRPLRHLIPP